jgi:hypothetical protein
MAQQNQQYNQQQDQYRDQPPPQQLVTLSNDVDFGDDNIVNKGVDVRISQNRGGSSPTPTSDEQMFRLQSPSERRPRETWCGKLWRKAGQTLLWGVSILMAQATRFLVKLPIQHALAGIPMDESVAPSQICANSTLGTAGCEAITQPIGFFTSLPIVPFNLFFLIGLGGAIASLFKFFFCCNYEGFNCHRTRFGIFNTAVRWTIIVPTSGLLIGTAYDYMLTGENWVDPANLATRRIVFLVESGLIGISVSGAIQGNMQLIADHLKLLFSVFRRIKGGKGDAQRYQKMLDQLVVGAKFGLDRKGAKGVLRLMKDRGQSRQESMVNIANQIDYTGEGCSLGARGRFILSTFLFPITFSGGLIANIPLVGTVMKGIESLFGGPGTDLSSIEYGLGGTCAASNALLLGPTLHYGAIEPMLQKGFVSDFWNKVPGKEKGIRAFIICAGGGFSAFMVYLVATDPVTNQVMKTIIYPFALGGNTAVTAASTFWLCRDQKWKLPVCCGGSREGTPLISPDLQTKATFALKEIAAEEKLKTETDLGDGYKSVKDTFLEFRTIANRGSLLEFWQQANGWNKSNPAGSAIMASETSSLLTNSDEKSINNDR